MRKLLIRPQARVDMLEAWHFIARQSIQAANRVLEDFEIGIRKIRAMPGIGHTRRDVTDERYRFWRVHSYLIVYRFSDQEVTIVRVVHGHRDMGPTLNR